MTAPKPRRRSIRFAIVAVLCLLLGAVTTVGVAWRIRESVPGPLWLGLGEPCLIPAGVEVSQTNSTTAQWPIDQARLWGRPPDVLFVASFPGFEKQTAERFEAASGSYYADLELSGWPFRAMKSERLRAPHARANRNTAPRDGTFVSLSTGIWRAHTYPARPKIGFALPCLPIFPGFALDTALYAAAWYLLIFTPLPLIRAGRRRFRVSRGMCGSCGYDLNASTNRPCPECGNPPRGEASP